MASNDNAPTTGTAIRQCTSTCESEYQDKKFGKRMRIHNVGGVAKNKTYRCTICGVKKLS